MGRAADRRGFTEDVRLALLEGDMDSVETIVKGWDEKFEAIRRSNLGILAGIVVASILMVINVIVLSQQGG